MWEGRSGLGRPSKVNPSIFTPLPMGPRGPPGNRVSLGSRAQRPSVPKEGLNQRDLGPWSWTDQPKPTTGRALSLPTSPHTPQIPL